MLNRKSLPRVLLLLAAFVFFSANTIHFVEHTDGPLFASEDLPYHLEFDDVIKKGPRLNARATILVNYDNGEVIYAQNAEKVRPIASLSKLMMAMVLIDSGLDLDSTTVTITREDARRSSRSRMRVGFEASLRDMLYAALLNSDNRAARAIARAVAGSYDEFATLMNIKARKLGLKKTAFVEPTGLSNKNVSTAHEVAMLLHYAYDYRLIAEITSEKRHNVTILNKKRTHRQMANTNLIIHSRYDVLAGKTGYIRDAGYCLATLCENEQGERLTAVVLGVPGDNLRFREARRLLDWGFRKIPRETETHAAN